MEHLDWPTGIRSLRQLIADRTGLVWPSFACRFFVRMRGAEADCIIGNFQGMVVDRPTELDLVIERPTVLQGFLTRDDMLTMLDRWEQRASFTIGEWVISPPSVTRVGLDPDALPQNYAPLLEPLPAHGSIYRMHRLWGGGETDNDAGNEIADAAFELGLRSEQLLEQYLGISTSPVVSYLMIQLPIPVALDTGYDMSNREVTASVFYRKPYQPSDFWVRMGARWSVSLPLLTVSEEADVGNGWRCATVSHQLDTATGGVQVWAGWSSEPTQFRWTSGRSLGEPITPATRRRDFLSPFYALSRQPLSNHIARFFM